MMRTQLFRFLAAFLTVTSGAALLFAGSGQGWECGGSTNCAGTDTCANQVNGHSCANISPINHKKCLGNPEKSCAEKQVDCLKYDYYSGGQCTDGSCENGGAGSEDESATLQEAGC